ncbi:hypothetical protein FNV43_RR26989 [Rhamnella rubrinervis]|uniref:Amino acid transporter transmembrane domain-containing protein n=1 Tax=Rhamnella rubrinervis TaxID=2594499 RepID=A0A8K0GS35_9ROSA|nr:hypothetical protein FNV43_RR26989 [Rhamnella rubrinervis]
MTIGAEKPHKSRKCKQPSDEKSALLLPDRHDNDENAAQEFDGASFTGAVFNLSTTIIGAGIMVLPATMKVLGLGLGVGLIVFVAIMTEASYVDNVGIIVMCCLDHLQMEFTMLEYWKGGLGNIGGLAVPSFIEILINYSCTGSRFSRYNCGIAIIKLFNGSIARILPKVTGITSVWKLFTVVPVLVTAFICHYNGNELEDSSLIKPVVRTSLVLCFSVYIMTSFFGFLLFGDSTLDDVLANFDTNLGIPYSSLLNDVVRISYALHLVLVFPIIFYPLRLNMDDLLFPSSGQIIFTGATAVVCIGFIFPASITLKDPHGIATKKDKILSVFMIVLAVFSNLMAIYSNVSALFERSNAFAYK